MKQLKEILRLSITLAQAEFKLKNEGSYLGILWYLLNPLLMFSLLLFIFSQQLGKNIEHYPLYLLFGIILFNLFRIVTTESTRVIYEHRLLIKSTKFPIEALVGALIFKALFSHIFEIIVFVFTLWVFHIPIVNIIFYLPILLCLTLFLYGFALVLASLTIYFMDLENIWAFMVQVLWFLTPIFYAAELNSHIFFVNLFNPMYYFITLGRQIIIYTSHPSTWLLAGMLGYTILMLFVGQLIFSRLKQKFSELM